MSKTHLLLYLLILVHNTTVRLIVYSCYVTVSALTNDKKNKTFDINVLVNAEININ